MYASIDPSGGIHTHPVDESPSSPASNQTSRGKDPSLASQAADDEVLIRVKACGGVFDPRKVFPLLAARSVALAQHKEGLDSTSTPYHELPVGCVVVGQVAGAGKNVLLGTQPTHGNAGVPQGSVALNLGTTVAAFLPLSSNRIDSGLTTFSRCPAHLVFPLPNSTMPFASLIGVDPNDMTQWGLTGPSSAEQPAASPSEASEPVPHLSSDEVEQLHNAMAMNLCSGWWPLTLYLHLCATQLRLKRREHVLILPPARSTPRDSVGVASLPVIAQLVKNILQCKVTVATFGSDGRKTLQAAGFADEELHALPEIGSIGASVSDVSVHLLLERTGGLGFDAVIATGPLSPFSNADAAAHASAAPTAGTSPSDSASQEPVSNLASQVSGVSLLVDLVGRVLRVGGRVGLAGDACVHRTVDSAYLTSEVAMRGGTIAIANGSLIHRDFGLFNLQQGELVELVATAFALLTKAPRVAAQQQQQFAVQSPVCYQGRVVGSASLFSAFTEALQLTAKQLLAGNPVVFVDE